MISQEKLEQLTLDECEALIQQNRQSMRLMVGQLYPSILRDEIIQLHQQTIKLKKKEPA